MNIRTAKVEDAEFISWAILESSRAGKKHGLFDLIFAPSKNINKSLENLVSNDVKTICHYSNFLIAEVDGKQAGALCGYDGYKLSWESMSEALSSMGCEGDYKERISAYLMCEPELGKNTIFLNFMITKESFRGLGVLKALVKKVLLTARLKGFRKAQTDIEIGSIETQMAYEKMGFRKKEEKKSDYYLEEFGRAGITSYVAEL
ncbi:GNAT family N-acetyltransferase [Sulfurimonas sp. MAG313]|nr:GNAT family N-acetyltransferase [Sulfurimonas sp. MAG313]MDF1881967.1 GNAT family N-acetyltransferase [Sulfurimonas sp. MAG313]